MAIATTANWVGNYIIAQATPVMFGLFGFGTFYVFGGFCILALGMALWLPEPLHIQFSMVAGSRQRPKHESEVGTTVRSD